MKILPNIFKKRDWVLVGTSTTDPQHVDLEKLPKDFPYSLLQKLILGTTTYLWEDSVTKEVRKKEVLGVEEAPLRQVLRRVDMYGRFDILDGDKKYVVVKVEKNPVLPLVSRGGSSEESAIIPEDFDLSQLPIKKP